MYFYLEFNLIVPCLYHYYYYQCLSTIVIVCFNNMLINLPMAYNSNTFISIKYVIFITLLISCGLCVQSQHKNMYMPFNNDWKVQILQDPRTNSDIRGKSFTTSTPTNIHLDLLKHNRIDDPYFGTNVLKLSWLAQCKLRYSKQFSIDQANHGRTAQIVFYGIDTFATVSINGKVIIQANNAHRTYTARIDKYILQQKTNLLEVIIEPTSKYQKEQAQKYNETNPYGFVRKPVYQYGGEWTPNLVTLGIWQPVELRFYDQIRIDYVWVRNKVVSDQRAVLNFAVKFELNLFKNQVIINNVYVLEIYLKDKKIGSHRVTQDTAYTDVTIENPKLWWPNGIGQPYLYNFTVYLTKHKERIDHRFIPFGIRTVQLNLQSKKFELKVNGYLIYCKGANYMPIDMLYPRLLNADFIKPKTKSLFSSLSLSTKSNIISQFSIQKLLDDAVDSNFNMLRIWGGGNYESEHFIHQASKRGIMIFYDFMFSQTSYPIEAEFLENVEEQIKQQVRKVRNHPSVVIWSGSDEVLYKLEQKSMKNATIKKNYQKLFDKLIREVVKIEDPFTPYIVTSPIYGAGSRKFEQKGGDAHLWGVWGNKQPFETLYQTVPHFTTEFGIQSLPLMHTVKQFIQDQQDINYASATLQAHQRHYNNFTTLTQYLQKYYLKPTHFKYEIYLSEIMQAYALETGIIAQRTAKQKSSGCLYWSFNEPWPSVSMATVDYYGRWKAAQYIVKRAFSDIAIFTLPNNSVIAINDHLYPAEVSAKLLLIYLNGSIIHQEQKQVKLQPNSASIVYQIEPSLIKNKEKQVMTYTQIYYNHTLMMRSSKFYSAPRDLTLMKAILTVTIEKAGNHLTVSSNRVIKSLFINAKKQYVRFSDNYFDVVPGLPIEIKVVSQDMEISQLQKDLEFYSVRETSLEDDHLEVIYK